MHVVFTSGGAWRELELVVHDPEASVADLLSRLAPGVVGCALEADGRRLPPDLALDRAGIGEGAELRVVPARPPRPEAPGAADAVLRGGVALHVTGGLDAGGRIRLGPGRWRLGRRGGGEAEVHLSSPTVSPAHAHLDLADGGATIDDLGSTNGTWVRGSAVTRPTALPLDESVRLGATVVALRPAGPLHERTARRPLRTGPTTAFNRPPPRAPAPPPVPVELPVEEAPPTPPLALGVATVVVPLVMGLVMVAVFHNPMFGLFAALGPVMVVAGTIEARRRGRRHRRRAARRRRAEVAAFRARLVDLADVERRRLDGALPDPAEVIARTTRPSPLLWERRTDHPQWLQLRGGIGPVRWRPPVPGPIDRVPDDVGAVLDEVSTLAEAPVVVDLSGGGVVGVVGPRPAALALARSLVVQAATHHGPADLSVMVLTGASGVAAWEWTKWLPHTVDPRTGRRLLAHEPDRAEELLRDALARAVSGSTATGATTLVLVDDDGLIHRRRAPARSVLRGDAGPVAGVVVAASPDRLPASCTTVIDLQGEDGAAEIHRPGADAAGAAMLACGLGLATADRAARALAAFDDPEVEAGGAALPSSVHLLALLGLGEPSAEALARAWRDAGPDPQPVAVLGRSVDGVVEVDLHRDGPHGLVAGTTGAGKSELLRTLVASLAVRAPPDQLTFLLIDFKGGSAFDRCARLPHTVGVVTDLDQHLAERALRCLEAELRRRERHLRAVGAVDLTEYRRVAGVDPLPRLVVVVDEFATLRAELPDFVDALVSVAQRGRSLGVHLVLATQRPACSVSDHIRANTNLRIALRMQDESDARDVVDRPDAAHIGRDQPGRAVARLGPGEVVTLQTAMVTGHGAGHAGPVDVRPFRFDAVGAGGVPAAPSAASSAGHGRSIEGAPASDLERLVDAALGAHRLTGRPLPRRPWPEPLRADAVDLDTVLARTRTASGADDGGGGPVIVPPVDGAPATDRLLSSIGTRGDGRVDGDWSVPFGVADDPDGQRHVVSGWVPAEGPLLLVGVAGSGTTTALLSIGLTAAAIVGPDRLHLYGLDHGIGELAALGGLDHTGAVVTAGERERQIRLVRWLGGEVARRRAGGAAPSARSAPETPTAPPPERRLDGAPPRLVVLVDGLGPLRAAWGEVHDHLVDDLVRVAIEGSSVGVHVAITADRPGAVPHALLAAAPRRLGFRLADDLDRGALGLSTRAVPRLPAGGAVDSMSGLVVQVARPSDGVEAAAARHRRRWASEGVIGRPVTIGELPDAVAAADLVADAVVGGPGRWFLPIGVGERALTPVGWTLDEGEHVLVAGPPRSGRTTALATIAEVALAAAPGLRVVGVAGGRSPLGRLVPGLEVIDPASRAAVADLGRDDGPSTLVLIDDVDRLADDHDDLWRSLVTAPRPGCHVVVAGRTDALRALYAHWVHRVRVARIGLLLQPDVDLDGDLLGARVPRRSDVPITPGRGYLVGADPLELIHVARPSSTA